MKPLFRASVAKLCPIFFALALLPGIAFSQLVAVPLTAASFNQDVIAESGISPLLVTSAPFDGPVSNQVFYTKAFQAFLTNFLLIPGGGLPNSGTIVNGADHWQLAGYGGNNCLLFPPQVVASKASLTLATAGKYIQISLLVSSGNGPCNVNINLHFTDLTSSSYGSFSVDDWFGGSPYVINGLGRVGRVLALGAATGLGTGDPRLYQIIINLSAADMARNLDRIDITDNSTNNTTTVGFFALSGRLFLLPQELSSLEADYDASQNKVGLRWTAYNIQVQEHFEIQRSVTGSDFSQIGSIVPQKNGLTQSFTYNDAAPAGGSGWYYRVKKNSADGSYSYSNTVFVRVAAGGLSLAQSEGVTIRLTGGVPDAVYHYRLANLSGQRLQSGILSSANGNSLDMSRFPRGIYLLAIEKEGHIQTFRFFRE